MKLDVAYIARRQRELGLSRRDVASALNVSLTRLTSLLAGRCQGTFSLAEVGRLADTLACPPSDLVREGGEEPKESTGGDQAPIAVIGALLHAADGPVSVATLAAATGTDLDVVEVALAELDRRLERLGLTIRRNTNDGSISIVAASIVSDEQLRVVLRGQEARQELSTNAATLLHRIMAERVTPRSVEATNDRRVQFGRLVNAEYVKPGTRRNQALELSDDVRESLLLDAR